MKQQTKEQELIEETSVCGEKIECTDKIGAQMGTFASSPGRIIAGIENDVLVLCSVGVKRKIFHETNPSTKEDTLDVRKPNVSSIVRTVEVNCRVGFSNENEMLLRAIDICNVNLNSVFSTCLILVWREECFPFEVESLMLPTR